MDDLYYLLLATDNGILASSDEGSLALIAFYQDVTKERIETIFRDYWKMPLFEDEAFNTQVDMQFTSEEVEKFKKVFNEIGIMGELRIFPAEKPEPGYQGLIYSSTPPIPLPEELQIFDFELRASLKGFTRPNGLFLPVD